MNARYAIPLIFLLGGCLQAADKAPEEIRTVRVVRVGVAESARKVEYAGEVRARHETRLAFRVSGKIVERLVDVGASVQAGQPVARLDAADLTLALASAKAQTASIQSERDFTEAELKRYRDLREKNFISQAEYDRRASAFATADSRLDAARAQERQSANQMAYAVLHADTAGIVTAVEAEAGQVVAAGQTVLRLARPGEREIVFSVPEVQRDLIEKASQFNLTLLARPGKTWKARLRELSPAADPATRTYAARATIVDPGNDVELGMSARIEMTVGTKSKSILVPISALHSRGDNPQVFLVAANGVVQPQPVRTGGIVGESVVIESGLKPGDVVVAAGANLLRAGQRVKILNEK
jgi:multidrug efflux system membrane fusion protein